MRSFNLSTWVQTDIALSLAKHRAHVSQKDLLFLLKPLFAKWRKSFPNPRLSILSVQPIQPELWEKTLKLSTPFVASPEQINLLPMTEWLVVIMDSPQLEVIQHALSQLKPGGAFALVCPNLKNEAKTWDAFFDQHGLVSVYKTGFHAQGAAAWWPWDYPGLLALGKLIDNLMMFIPGRYELGLSLGRHWIIRAQKQDDITVF